MLCDGSGCHQRHYRWCHCDGQCVCLSVVDVLPSRQECPQQKQSQPERDQTSVQLPDGIVHVIVPHGDWCGIGARWHIYCATVRPCTTNSIVLYENYKRKKFQQNVVYHVTNWFSKRYHLLFRLVSRFLSYWNWNCFEYGVDFLFTCPVALWLLLLFLSHLDNLVQPCFLVLLFLD